MLHKHQTNCVPLRNRCAGLSGPDSFLPEAMNSSITPPVSFGESDLLSLFTRSVNKADSDRTEDSDHYSLTRVMMIMMPQ